MTTSQEIDKFNIETVTRWVEEISDGYFTAEQEEGFCTGRFRIFRKDGQPLSFYKDRPTTAALIEANTPYLRKLDRRHRTVMSEVVKGVKFTEDTLEAPEDVKLQLFISRHEWMNRNRVTFMSLPSYRKTN